MLSKIDKSQEVIMKPYFIDDNEKILWEGRPSKLMYFFSGFNLFAVIFLIIWASMVMTISRQAVPITGELGKITETNSFGRSFGTFALIPYIMIFAVLIIFVFIPIKKVIESFKVRYYAVSYTHLTLPTISCRCRSRWSPYH